MKGKNIKLLLFTMLLLGSAVAKAQLMVDFGSDTIYVCLDMPTTLGVSVAGGTEPYAYSWNTGEDTPTIGINHNSDGYHQYIVRVEDAQGMVASDTLIAVTFTECVWPGDADGDRKANHFDVLAMGLAFGHSGPVRPDAHSNWQGQTAPSWPQSHNNGVNFVHADADGDGLIHTNDFRPISLNYTSADENSGGSVGNAQDPAMFFGTPVELGNPDSLAIPLMLGQSNLPASNVHGVAFSFVYDPAQLGDSISIDTKGSWLGEEGSSIASFSYHDKDAGRVDISITRLDQIPQEGAGRFTDIIITIEDVVREAPINIEIRNIRVIDEQGNILPIFLEPGLFGNPLSTPDNLTNKFRVYPNPIQKEQILNINIAEQALISVIDLMGNSIKEEELMPAGNHRLLFSDLSNGVYFVKIRTENRNYTHKILVQ